MQLRRILMLVDPQQGTKDHLDGAVAEAIAVKQASSAEVKILEGSDATFKALVLEIADSDVLHFGCHAEFSSSSGGPAAYILLADSGSGTRRMLNPEQIIEGLPADNVQLVNLSACNSGLLRTDQQTEMNGLSTAFLAAGAKAVLASLWPLHDVPARKFSVHFYAAFQQCKQPGEALRATQLACSSGKLGYEMSKPYSWAGYILMGVPMSE